MASPAFCHDGMKHGAWAYRVEGGGMLARVVLGVLLTLAVGGQCARAQTVNSAMPVAAQDLAEQLAAQVPKWFDVLGAQGRVPRVFTGIARDARQFIVELDELPFDHVKRRDFLVWLSWKRNLVAYAYATRVMTAKSSEQSDLVEQLAIYASSFEKDVAVTFNLFRMPDGTIKFSHDKTNSEPAKELPDQPLAGLHRGLQPDRMSAAAEFETAFAALEPKIVWRQVQKPAGSKEDGSPRGLIEQAIKTYAAGNYEAALRLGREAGEFLAKLNGSDSKDVASALVVQALSQKRLQRAKEAESLYRQAIQIYEKTAGESDKDLAVALDNLASHYVDEGRLAEAEPLRLRALQIFRATLDPSSPSIGTTLQNLGVLYQQQGRYALARDRLLEAVTIIEKAEGAGSHALAVILDNLAGIHRHLGEAASAEPLYQRAIAIFRMARGREHPDTALALQNYAILLSDTGRSHLAESVLEEAIKIQEGLYGPDHPSIAAALNTLVLAYIEQQRWPEALAAARRSAVIAVSTAGRSEDVLTTSRRNATTHRRLAQVAFKAGPSNEELMNEAFVAAQHSLSNEASSAMSQLSARHAIGNGALALLLRERQDLIDQSKAEDRTLIRAIASSPDRRDVEGEKRARGRLDSIELRLRKIDLQLGAQFPRYATLSNPAPITISAVQALLHPNEALLQLIDLPETGRVKETGLAWLITKDHAEWVALPIGTDWLARAVATLRCGLDARRWSQDGPLSCVSLLKVDAPAPDSVLPFDLDAAFQLYQALLGPFEKTIARRSLLIVSSGSLAELPPAVLVAAKPSIARPATSEGYRSAAWLGVRQPITILPSVSSLQALRETSQRAGPSRPYLGIGNPLLDGRQNDPEHGQRFRELARIAREAQDCREVRARTKASGAARSISRPAVPLRRASADLDAVRQASPLPETAHEICTVGDRLGAGHDDILLGGRATKGNLMSLSDQGQLASYGIVHFATHGALAGELKSGSEPGLLLTPLDTGPPGSSSQVQDDGYLTVSEIATLKLNADWVILSACNTAGSSGESSATLSGMGRAFIYAGSRALLVSHWEVASDPAVKLVTRAVTELKASPQIGRAEALQRSMHDLIQNGDPSEAHPAQWAPFVVVGEGATDMRVAAPVPSPPKPNRPARSSRTTAKPKTLTQPSPPDWQQELWRR